MLLSILLACSQGTDTADTTGGGDSHSDSAGDSATDSGGETGEDSSHTGDDTGHTGDDTGHTGDDTGHTGDDTGDTGGPHGPRLMSVGGECGADTCTWFADADGSIGMVELYLSETGDTTSPNFWEEVHTAFRYVGPSAYGGDEFALELDLVHDYREQIDNVSTLFDLNNSTISAQLTVMFLMYDPRGNYADCATYGHDPTYFSAACTNVW